MPDQELNNIVFNILPFRCKQYDRRGTISSALRNSALWQPQQNETRYFMRYVTDNLQKEEQSEVQMQHYSVSLDDVRQKFPALKIPDRAAVYKENGTPAGYLFTLKSIELFWFATGIGVISIGVQYDVSDPLYISYAEYELKKANRSKMKWQDADGQNCEMTLMQFGKMLLQEDLQESSYEMFFYDNPGHERANVLSYVEQTKDRPDWEEYEKKSIFFLRRCYGKTFVYDPDEKLESNQLHRQHQHILWGISRENIACIAYPAGDESGFMDSTYYGRVSSEYLLMYILLLHQKYALYDLLMDIDTDTYQKLGRLIGYQDKLHKFQAHFWFNIITEVPQYQDLYNKIRSRMALDALMQDVKEPLDALVSQQRDKEERAAELRAEDEARRDRRMNRLLTIISLLAILSAIADGFGIIDAWPGNIAKWICVAVIIIGVLLPWCLSERKAKKAERNKTNEK